MGSGSRGRTRRRRPFPGAKTGPNPTDRGKPGTKRHVVVDANGIPLAVRLSAANVHDCKMFVEMIDAIQPIRRPIGGSRKRPNNQNADKGYDYRFCRGELRCRGIISRIASRGIERGDRLGHHRWVVEHTLAWFNQFRRFLVRYERRDDVHQAFLSLSAAFICWAFFQFSFTEGESVMLFSFSQGETTAT